MILMLSAMSPGSAKLSVMSLEVVKLPTGTVGVADGVVVGVSWLGCRSECCWRILPGGEANRRRFPVQQIGVFEATLFLLLKCQAVSAAKVQHQIAERFICAMATISLVVSRTACVAA